MQSEAVVLVCLTLVTSLDAQSKPTPVDRISQCYSTAVSWVKDVENGVFKPSGAPTGVLMHDFRECVQLSESTPAEMWPKDLSKSEYLAALWKAIATVQEGETEKWKEQFSRVRDECGGRRPTLKRPVSLGPVKRDVNAENRIAEKFVRMREAAKLPAYARLDGADFAKAACDAATEDKVEEQRVENRDAVAFIYSTSDPEMGDTLAYISTRPWKHVRNFVVGACYARSPTYLSGRYWIAIGVLGGKFDKFIADLLGTSPRH